MSSVPLSNLSYYIDEGDDNEINSRRYDCSDSKHAVVSANLMIKRFQNIGYGFDETDKLFEGDPGLLSIDKLDFMNSEFKTNQDLHLHDIELFEVDRAITPIEPDFDGRGVLTVDEAMKMANSHITNPGIHSFHQYESARNYTDYDFDYNLSHAEFDRELIPHTEYLERKIPRINKESPKRIKPRVKTVKSEFEAETIHRNFYERVTNWKQAIHNRNVAKYFNSLQGKSQNEMEECSFHPKISDFKTVNNEKVLYHGDKRADQKKLAYQQKQDEILTFQPKISKHSQNGHKYENLLPEFKECTFQPDISSSNGNQTDVQKKPSKLVFERLNKQKIHNYSKILSDSRNNENLKPTSLNCKIVANKTVEIESSIFDSQNHEKEINHTNFINRQIHYENERQKKLTEMAQELIKDIGVPAINSNSKKILENRRNSPIVRQNKQVYLGIDHKEDKELTFKPQISKYASEIDRKSCIDSIHNQLYQETEKRKLLKDQIIQKIDKEVIEACPFKPQILEGSTRSRFKVDLANYKELLQAKDKACKQQKQINEELQMSDCTYKPHTIELPEFIKKNLEDTKELREEMKALKEILKTEEKPRWVSQNPKTPKPQENNLK